MAWIANRGEGWAELYDPDPDTVCISIVEPNREPARLRKGYVDILRVEFQDYDPIGPDHPYDAPAGMYQSSIITVLRKIPENAILITPRIGARIARFARKYRGKNILVHCAAGISRSGAVVEALMEAFPEYEDKGWPRHPNGLVKLTMKRALGLVPIGAEKETNR